MWLFYLHFFFEVIQLVMNFVMASVALNMDIQILEVSWKGLEEGVIQSFGSISSGAAGCYCTRHTSAMH
jgi:hypothetical protein